MSRRLGLLTLLVCTVLLVTACSVDYSGQYGGLSDAGIFVSMTLGKDGTVETNMLGIPVSGTYTISNDQIAVKLTTMGYSQTIKGRITKDTIEFSDATLKRGVTSVDISDVSSLLGGASQTKATATPTARATEKPTPTPVNQAKMKLEEANSLSADGNYEAAIDIFMEIYFDLNVRKEIRTYYINMSENDIGIISSQLAEITDFTIEEKDYIFYEAMRFLRSGKYDKAIVGFSALGEYRDSSTWVEECELNQERLDNYTYENKGNGIILKEYAGYETKVIIPIGVIELKDGSTWSGGVFRGNTRMQEVILPDTLKSIGSHSFTGCANLKNISIPESVDRIYFNAFSESGLESICIPRSVTTFGHAVFSGCSNLREAVFNCKMESLPSETFSNCTLLTKFEVPYGVIQIGTKCFEGCTALESIKLPSTLKEFSSFRTFAGCTSLKEIALPEGMTNIGWITFSGCSSLQEIVIPEGVTYLDDEMFMNCIALEKVTLPSKLTAIDSGAFANCTNLTELTIPRSVKSIAFSAFSKMNSTQFNIYEGSYSHKYFDEMREKGYDYNTSFITK